MRKMLSVKIRMLLAVLIVSTCAFGQEPARVFHGTWILTIGKTKVLHGKWSGGTLPRHANYAVGTWTVETTGQVALKGTWRAQKSEQGWEGSWTGHTAQGQSLAATWGASFEHWHGKTLQDMLARTLIQRVSGWWRSGHEGGEWWLKGSP